MRLLAVALAVLVVPLPAHAGFAPQAPPPPAQLPGIARVPNVSTGNGVGRELHEARRSIKRRAGSGELSRKEARALRREASRIDRRQEWFARDGLSQSEADQLRLSAEALRYRAQTLTRSPPA